MTKAQRSAREVAFGVLNEFNVGKGNAGEILHKMINQTDRRQQATDIVFGVIRNRPAIDMVISKTGDTQTDRISKRLLNILRIGTYELIFAPQTAQYAIVNEAVNLAHSFAGKKQADFINAVLRGVIRGIAARKTELSGADVVRILPQSETSGCLFSISLLPDPKENPAEYLSKAFSLPKCLISEWVDEFGFDSARKICLASNRRPRVFLRPNILMVSAQELGEKLAAAEVESEIEPDNLMIRVKTPQPVSTLAGFAEGLFSVQDPTASQAVRLLKPQPGWVVLDLCAAPGGKTTQMAELMGDKGRIIATDIDVERLLKVNENCERLGIKSVETIKYERLGKIISETGGFDAVLLDVPCSNTGVLARRPEVRLRINEQAVTQLAKTQLQLLETAAKMLKTGGRICYSTCSIVKQENSEVVKQFLTKDKGFMIECEKLFLPSAPIESVFDCDGGYVAIIIKK